MFTVIQPAFLLTNNPIPLPLEIIDGKQDNSHNKNGQGKDKRWSFPILSSFHQLLITLHIKYILLHYRINFIICALCIILDGFY